MCAVSFDKEALNITIHNQYPDLDLTSPVYFSNGTTCCVSPSHQIGIGTITEASFGIDFHQKDFKCVFLYKLQRKHTTKTDNQPNNSTTSIKDRSTNIHILIVWDFKDNYHRFCAYLIEFTDDLTWDEDKLWALYEEYNKQFYMNYEPRIITWSVYDNAMMEMKLKVSYGTDYKLDIVLSRGVGKYSVEKPMEINPKW
jgi:hypothetical protein